MRCPKEVLENITITYDADAAVETYAQYKCTAREHELMGPTVRQCMMMDGTLSWQGDQPICGSEYSFILLFFCSLVYLFICLFVCLLVCCLDDWLID